VTGVLHDRPAAASPSNAVTCVSVVGCSGHPIMKRALKHLVPDRYLSSVREDGERVKLAGHLAFTGRNLALFQEHDLRSVLVVRDPRDNFVNLVNRSRYGYCPEKFDRPRTHPDAVEFHRLLMAHAEPGRTGVVDHYVEGIGALATLRRIFEVARWHGHPRIHTVRFEDFIDLRGEGHAAQRPTIARLAEFLGVEGTDEDIDRIATTNNQWIRWKVDRQPEYVVGWQEVFTDEDRAAFKRHFGDVLLRLGYEADDDW
jgi:hypothetical protein